MFDYGNDRYAKACLSEAEKGRSPMRFGSVLVKGNSIIGRGRNRLANAQLREKMKYVDYCIHAEQDAILDALNKGIDPSGARCYVFGYVASGKYKGTYTTRETPVFGCKRCPHTLEKYNVSVVIPHVDGWVKLSPKEAKETANGISGIWTNLIKNGEISNYVARA
jgi:hypothetical protein